MSHICDNGYVKLGASPRSSATIMKNQVQLIAYVDRLSGGGFAELNRLLKGPLAGVFGGAHLLALFRPHRRRGRGL